MLAAAKLRRPAGGLLLRALGLSRALGGAAGHAADAGCVPLFLCSPLRHAQPPRALWRLTPALPPCCSGAQRPLRLVERAESGEEEDESAPVLRWVDEAAAANPELQARPSCACFPAPLRRLRQPLPRAQKVVRVAVVGAPNAGKSTLTNALVGRMARPPLSPSRPLSARSHTHTHPTR